MEYKAPSPPKGGGPHRYTILVFVQPSHDLKVEKKIERDDFDVEEFAKDLQLGSPAAFSFFMSAAT